MKMPFQMLLLPALGMALGSCATEIVPSSGSRPPLQPAQVKVYQKEPAKYEKLGPITLVITATTHWEKTADATPAFEQLKAQAAAMGGNGLLLIDDAHQEVERAGAKYRGTVYLVPIRSNPPAVAVQAIYVANE